MLVSEQIGTRSRRYAMSIGETRASIESMAEDTVSVTPSHIHFTLNGNRSQHPYEEGRAFHDPPFPNPIVSTTFLGYFTLSHISLKSILRQSG